MKYTTPQAASKVGITRATLQAWIAGRKFKAPAIQKVGRIAVRLWTDKDIAVLRAAKRKLYRKNMGRPRKPKS